MRNDCMAPFSIRNLREFKMSQNAKKTSTTNELARERNRAAADRTLMAWIRTALSLIAFGFSIGKIAEYLKKANPERVIDPINSTKIFGEAFIALGVLGLLAAIAQHRRIIKKISRGEYVYTEPFPLVSITAIILMFIGLFGFVAVLL
jgi:putative membrane protein